MSERRNNGQFKKGNPGGPGRPPRMVEMDYLSALSEHVPREEFAEIVRDAVARARNGDATPPAGGPGMNAGILLPRKEHLPPAHAAAVFPPFKRCSRARWTSCPRVPGIYVLRR